MGGLMLVAGGFGPVAGVPVLVFTKKSGINVTNAMIIINLLNQKLSE